MPEWLTIANAATVVTAAISLAAVIAAITPSKADDAFIQKVLNVVNMLAINVGKARNADSQ